MAITYSTPGQYTLGGISAPRRGIAESFQAGVSANLGRQELRQQMQEREQSMQLRASEEQRRQQQFEAAQAARGQAAARAAQAAARAAQERAAMDRLMEGLSGIGDAPAAGAAPTGVIAPTAPPRAGLAPPTGSGVPLSFGTAVPGAPPATPPATPPVTPPVAPPAAPAGTPFSMRVTPTGAAGVQVATLDPREAYRLAFEARPDLFGGGVAPAYDPRLTPEMQRAMRDMNSRVPPEPSILSSYGYNPQDWVMAARNRISGQYEPGAEMQGTPQVTPDMPATGQEQFALDPLVQSMAGWPADIPTLPDGSPDWAAFERQLEAAAGVITMRPDFATPDAAQYGPVPFGVDRITEVDPAASAAMQDLQALSRRMDINNAATRIGNSVLERTSGFADYFLRTPEEGAQRAEARAQGERVRDWYTSDDAQAIFQENPVLLQEAARDPLSFYQQYSGETLAPDAVLPEEVAEPASPEAAAAEAPTTAEEAAPTQDTPWGGLQLNFGTPVQLSFGEFDGRGSEAYVAAPERIFQDADLVARQRQRLQLLANYYQQTNNFEGLIGVINQLDELAVEQRYLDGMTAIVGIQQENFGPVQALLQQRYPGRQVEVRPYTDGTVEIFLDDQSEARLTWDDMAQNLRSVYDRGFIEQQQALAEEAASRSRFLFERETEQMLQGAREIAVANNQAEIDRLEGSGRITRIGETANGEVVFETVVNGVPIQFVYRETMTRDPATGAEIPALVATPIDQSLVQ